MTLSISKVDKPEAEIGNSQTTSEILTLQSGNMIQGRSPTLLQAVSKSKGSSTVRIESSVKDLLFSASSSFSMTLQLPEKLGLFILQTVLGNSKYTVPLQVLDRDGFPIKTRSDVEILFVPSVDNIVSAPHTVILPKGEYYTTLLIEAEDAGTTEIAALANGFQSTKLDIAVATAHVDVKLVPYREGKSK